MSNLPGRVPNRLPVNSNRKADKLWSTYPHEVMGHGDDELGRILMAKYLDTLSHFASSIDKVIFVNSGVKLTVEDSPVLDSIRNLENAGVQILSCGTCLSHFGLKENLKVGEVSNMYAIIEAISKAQKVMMR